MCVCFFFFNHHFHFPTELVGGSTLDDLLDKPWSQVSTLLPGTWTFFVAHRVQHSHSSSIFNECTEYLITLPLFPLLYLLYEKKALTSMLSVELKPTKMILIGVGWFSSFYEFKCVTNDLPGGTKSVFPSRLSAICSDLVRSMFSTSWMLIPYTVGNAKNGWSVYSVRIQIYAPAKLLTQSAAAPLEQPIALTVHHWSRWQTSRTRM